MLYPSIQEILKATEKDGEERLNKYSIAMVTAKSARVITNEYIKQREEAEKKAKDKDDKEAYAIVKKEYRDEKAVKNALREIKEGEFEVYLPGDEGYDDSLVEIENYEPSDGSEAANRNAFADKSVINIAENDEDEEVAQEDVESEELSEEERNSLMGAFDVFDNDAGYIIEDGEDE